eukprot:197209-Amorphochlora_amoeboformis.AAC.1
MEPESPTANRNPIAVERYSSFRPISSLSYLSKPTHIYYQEEFWSTKSNFEVKLTAFGMRD